jgi:SAM-dependent methyltransferase
MQPLGQDERVPEARYDSLADWYDGWAATFMRPFARLLADCVAESVRPGSTVIDVGCGTGLHFAALQAAKLRPIGFDISGEQLRVASERAAPVVRADATAIAVRDEAVDVAVAAFVHRDMDDFAGAVGEVARVLRPRGRFAYVGTHPCFVAPFVDRTTERDVGAIDVRSGYGDTRRRFDSAAQSRLAAAAGSRNLSLAAFVDSFIGAGLRIESLEELDTDARRWVTRPNDGTIVPWNILVVAVKC